MKAILLASTLLLFINSHAQPYEIIIGAEDQVILNPADLQYSKTNASGRSLIIGQSLSYQSMTQSDVEDGKGIIWVKFKLKNESEKEHLFYLDFGLSDHFDLFKISESGEINHLKNGYLATREDRDFFSSTRAIPLTIPQGNSVEIFVRIENSFHPSSNLNWKILSADRWNRIKIQNDASDYIFQGITWVLFIFSSLIFFAFRERGALYYSCFLGSIAIIFLYLNEVIRHTFIGDYPEVIPYMMTVIPVAAGFYFLFAKNLLMIDQVYPKWNKWLIWLVRLDFIAAVAAIIIIAMDAGMAIATHFNNAVIIINAFFLLPFIIRMFRTNDVTAKYYVIGSCVFIVTVIVTVFSWRIGESQAPLTRIGFIIEMVFYSIGIGTRLRTKVQETQQKLIDQMKVNQELTREKNSELERLVQERTSKLEASVEELKTYDHMISHDLKSPLANISILVKLLEEEIHSKDPSGRQKILRLMKETSKRATNMVKDVLDFATADKPDKKLGEVDINLIMEEVLKTLAPLIESKNAKINMEGLPTVPNASAVKIYQLFQNLLDNALKFQVEDQNPKIRVYQNDCGEIIVEDNGVGIDPGDCEEIFKPHYRANKVHHFEGNGLGLATCKRICDLHNWSIKAESSEMGSKFTITFDQDFVSLKTEF